MELKWIKLPEHVYRTKTTIDKKAGLIAFVRFMQDSDADNPCESFDGVGRIYSLGHRHVNFNPAIIEENAGNPDCVLLSNFEHGQCLWGVAGTMSHMPDFRWDGVEIAGIWIPDPSVLESADMLGHAKGSSERRQWLEEQARSACEQYTCWCNGEVFGYSIAVHNLRQEAGNIFDEDDDYRFETAVFEDSCFGYYGWGEVERAAREVIDSATDMAGV